MKITKRYSAIVFGFTVCASTFLAPTKGSADVLDLHIEYIDGINGCMRCEFAGDVVLECRRAREIMCRLFGDHIN